MNTLISELAANTFSGRPLRQRFCSVLELHGWRAHNLEGNGTGSISPFEVGKAAAPLHFESTENGPAHKLQL